MEKNQKEKPRGSGEAEEEAPRIDRFRQAVRDTLWEEDPSLPWVEVEDTPFGVHVKNASLLHPDNRASLEALVGAHWAREGEVEYREGVLEVRDTLDGYATCMEKGASLRLGEILSLVDLLNREHDARIRTGQTYMELVEAVRAFILKLGYRPEVMKTLHDSMRKEASAVNPGEFQAGLIPNVEIPVMEKEAAVGDFSHGCLMLPAPYDLARQLVAWTQKHVLEKNLDAQGIDFQPHVTVCYGFQPDFDVEELRPLMKDYAYISAKLGKVSRFETEKYDVLKLEVISSDLRSWNRKIRERFDITTSYPDYSPHLTLAYIRPGTCKHLDGNSDWVGAILTNDRLEWSPADGAKKNLYLRTKRIVVQ